MGNHGHYYDIHPYDKADNPLKKILIITVNYKYASPTNSLVSSLEQCGEKDQIKLTIVDNESSDNTRKELEIIKENSTIEIHTISSKHNRYYWGGAAFALDKVDTSQFKWIIICNNDVVFNNPDIFLKLIDLDNENYPIIGPRIQSSHSKKDLNPFLIKSISVIQDIYYSLYYSNTITAKFVHAIGSILNRKSKINNQKSEISKIYAPHGSCVIFSNKYFTHGGYLDTGFTMYGEEVSTGEIAKSLDLPIHYMPSLSLIHNDHQSTSKSSRKENFLHSKKTYYYLKQKYRS